MESNPNPLAPATSEELVGDINSLAQAVGATDALAPLSALAELLDAPRPETLPAVREFMERYRERLLAPVELPAIRDAYNHASRGEVRELIALDRQLAREYGNSAFATASRYTGRTQLRRLRPLRNATLQRYLNAVDEGRATGWHVVVFGIMLALFSLPLRQGLVHYAARTQCSLLDSATAGVRVTTPERARLQDECEAPIVPAVQLVLPEFTPQLG
jgi:urease accessory protein UreF